MTNVLHTAKDRDLSSHVPLIAYKLTIVADAFLSYQVPAPAFTIDVCHSSVISNDIYTITTCCNTTESNLLVLSFYLMCFREAAKTEALEVKYRKIMEDNNVEKVMTITTMSFVLFCLV